MQTSKVLEKSLKDALKEKRLIMGTRQVMNSVRDSKLIILSRSVKRKAQEQIVSDAKKENVSLTNFQGTSVALGRLCGLQFRISTIAFTSIADTNIKTILKDVDTEEERQ